MGSRQKEGRKGDKEDESIFPVALSRMEEKQAWKSCADNRCYACPEECRLHQSGLERFGNE